MGGFAVTLCESILSHDNSGNRGRQHWADHAETFFTCNSVVWRTPGHGWRDKERGLNQHDAKKMKEETVKIRALLVALLVDMAGRWVPVGSIGCLIPGGLLILCWLNFPRGRSLERIAILILISMEMALQNIRSGSATRRDCLSGIEIKMGSCWWMQRFSTYEVFFRNTSLVINQRFFREALVNSALCLFTNVSPEEKVCSHLPKSKW